MEYPHRRYMTYLLSRRLTEGEVMEACTVRCLVNPQQGDLAALRRELGGIPNYWRAELDRTNTRLYRWLRDRDVLDLWKDSKAGKEASDFLYARDGQGNGPRIDFEHLILLDPDVGKARGMLEVKYGPLRTPSLDALNLYVKYFWDVRSMSQPGLFHFLEVQEDNETRMAAYSGDLAATYGMLGLRQKIDDEAFYDDVIALAHEQVQYARRRRGPLNGQQIMGIAALARVADDAIQSRRELRTAGLGDTIRNELQAFRLRKKDQRRQAIPSYEELLAQEAEEGNIIDVTHQLEAKKR